MYLLTHMALQTAQPTHRLERLRHRWLNAPMRNITRSSSVGLAANSRERESQDGLGVRKAKAEALEPGVLRHCDWYQKCHCDAITRNCGCGAS